jgi:transcription initiation factor TFIIB
MKWDGWLKWQNRNLLFAISEINRLGENLALPKYAKELAAIIFKKATRNGIIRGRSVKSMVGAAIYYACRKNGIPRAMQDIISETSVKPRDFHRAYRALVRKLKLKVPALDPRSFIPKYISALNLSRRVENRVFQLIEKYANKLVIGGKDPRGLCAGAIYLASQELDEPRTQHNIAQELGVTVVTIRSRYKELKKLVQSNLKNND